MEIINTWLGSIKNAQSVNYNLAVALVNAYRLKKGYSTADIRNLPFAMINDFAIAHLDADNIDEKVSHLIAYALQNHDANKTKQLITEFS